MMADMTTTKNKLPSTIKPMLGRLARTPFDSPNYIFELKWDGMRGLAFVEGGELRLLSRNGRNIATQFPELVMATMEGSLTTIPWPRA